MRNPLEKEKAAYVSQKYAALKRGVVFKLTFEEWHNWWIEQLGPNWRAKRGRKRGQYVMGRFGDVGPYELGNIKCILCTDNISEGGGNGALTPEQISGVYTAAGCHLYIAKKYALSKYTVFDIRRDRSWVKVTKRLTKGQDCDCQRTGINARKCPLV